MTCQAMTVHCVQVCQRGGSYEDFIAAHPALGDVASRDLQYTMLLPCASVLFSLLNYLADAVFFVDIALSFITGYYPHRATEPSYDLPGIASNYLRGSFFLDLVASIPWSTVR